jgi:formate transporter
MEPGDHFDAYSPKEMAGKAVAVGVRKANLTFGRTFALAMLAGAFIAMGACFFATVITGVPAELIGPARLIGGLAFCLGLILVVVGGAELFTGNILIVMAMLSGKVSFARMIRNWAIVYAGNLVGSLLIVALAYFAWQWKMGDCAVGATAYSCAAKKLSLPFVTAFCSGILCNVLVCLAVWLCYGARSVAGKIIAIIFPITAFVALGFEHSVANMYFIPYGMLLAKTGDFTGSPAAAHVLAKYAQSMFTVPNFLVNNLIPVTLGNIVGGGLFVGAVYWFAYLRGESEETAPDFVLARAGGELEPAAAAVQSKSRF